MDSLAKNSQLLIYTYDHYYTEISHFLLFHLQTLVSLVLPLVQGLMFLILLLSQVCYKKTNAINRIVSYEQKDNPIDQNDSSEKVKSIKSCTSVL